MKGDEVRIHVSLATGRRGLHRVRLRPVRPVRAHQRRLHDVTALEALDRALAAPPRVPLATLPTPLERGPVLPGGARLWVKRDDLTGLGMGGQQGPEAGAPVRRGAGGRRGHADHGRRRPVQPLPHDRGGRRSPRLARPPGAGRRRPGRAGRQPAPVEPLRRRAALRRGDGLGRPRGREGRPGRGAAGPREAALRHPDRRQHARRRGRLRGGVRRAPAPVRGGRTAAAIGRARQLERWDARRAAGRSSRGGGGRRSRCRRSWPSGSPRASSSTPRTRPSWPTPRSTTSA